MTLDKKKKQEFLARVESERAEEQVKGSGPAKGKSFYIPESVLKDLSGYAEAANKTLNTVVVESCEFYSEVKVGKEQIEKGKFRYYSNPADSDLASYEAKNNLSPCTLHRLGLEIVSRLISTKTKEDEEKSLLDALLEWMEKHSPKSSVSGNIARMVEKGVFEKK